MALMGPGARRGDEGGARRSRARGSVRVQEPAHAFFVAGSSFDEMNGIFGRVRPESARGVSSHAVNLCYKHDQSGWFMALIKAPVDERPYAYRTYGCEKFENARSPLRRAWLGAGQSGTGAITCVANASDTYGATGTTSNTDVTVSALESVSALKDVADTQIARAFRFVDPTAVNNVLTGVTESLNAVDCNNVPTSCYLLNRYDCSDTKQTCGACLRTCR